MNFEIEELAIPAVKLIRPKMHWDERGFFAEAFRKCDFEEAGMTRAFVQDNHVYNVERGTVRGLHFQSYPCAQDKLVRVIKGSILDVAVDLRRYGGSYGKHVAVILDPIMLQMLFVPVGFAHGYVTLQPDTEVQYKVSDYYAPDHEHGLRWNDPELGINWGIDEKDAIVSEKDQKQPLFKDLNELPSYFVA